MDNCVTKKIKITSLIILSGFVVAVTYHLIMAKIFNFDFPYNTFLFHQNDQFNDFNHSYNLTKDLNPYLSHPPISLRVYFPFGYLVFSFFAQLPYKISFILFQSAFILFSIIFLYKNVIISGLKNKILLLLSFFFSYPFIFTFDRGNIESVVFVLTCGFVILFMKGNYKLSIIPLACATAIKLFPIVFGILLLKKKKIKEFSYLISSALLLNIVSLLMFEGSIIDNILRLVENQKLYNAQYAILDSGLHFSHSIFSLIKILPLTMEQRTQVFIPYAIFCLIAFLAVSLYIIMYEEKLWKQLFLLVSSYCLLPYVSADYKLLLIFIPLILLICEPDKNRFDVSNIFLISLLLIPKAYISLPELIAHVKVPANIGTIINPLVMICVATLIIIDGIKKKRIFRNMANENMYQKM